jgi:pyridoxal phosphate enzyme (YggS family)
MSISDNLLKIKESIPEHVALVAVSKTMPASVVHEAYEAGHRLFGENKVQELSAKHPRLPSDIQWHFIGHLQTNKVKYIAPFVHMIESVDSLKLLIEINRQSAKSGRIINCLLQFHIAEEESKFGLNRKEAALMLGDPAMSELNSINIAGVMGMATFTDDMEHVRQEFRNLRNIFDWLKSTYFSDHAAFREISMGMSGDYPVAIEEGATIVRIGSLIFGERQHH